MNLYGKIALTSASFVFAGTLALPTAFAVDSSAETSVSSDTSKNPFTGTVTETQKATKKHKHLDGTSGKTETIQKKKTKTDGSTEKTTETETSHD